MSGAINIFFKKDCRDKNAWWLIQINILFKKFLNATHNVKNISIYNPWGCEINLKANRPGNPLVNIKNQFDIDNNIWQLQGYFTFNY